MSEANYWIAQYVEDLFRNEPRNVGVIVRAGDQLAARFLGEGEDQTIDGRKLKVFAYADVYRQWVKYWRTEIARNDTDTLVKRSGAHYRIVPAGQITDCDHDSAAMVAAYLYSLLVSADGFAAAISSQDAEAGAEPATVSLEAELARVFRDTNLLLDGDQLFVQHPVRKGAPVVGQRATHRPAFVQENGNLFVMEPVDFTGPQKKRSQDHAGLSAYMFRDILDRRSDAHTIAVVKFTDADKDFEEVSYGLEILGNEAHVVNWLNQDEQIAFLRERQAIAVHQ